jgi:hypothetical protein
MDLNQALRHFLYDRIENLSQTYDWSFSMSGFPDSNYYASGESNYHKSRNLRNFIFERISEGSALSKGLQIWYVKNWGGVKRNSPETLEGYIKSSPEELFCLGTKGVATWSKILSVRNPSKFAIYDARVALSINSLQKKYKVDDPVLFPQLSSQNRTFVQPTQRRILSSRYFSNSIQENFYSEYISLLTRTVSTMKGFDIQDAEMVLFSCAEELSRIWHEQ